MNIGEFIIKIGTQGDTKGLDEAIKKMAEAEKKTRKQIELKRKLAQATSDEEKELIKKNAAQQEELENLKHVKLEQDKLNSSMKNSISFAVKLIGAISGVAIVLDRMGNNLLKSNQQYTTFGKQTGISINNLNRMAGLAQLSGMNLSPEQVAGDLQSLQQKIFKLGLTGEGSGIFAQLGMNPLGMNSDQFIANLRARTKNLNGPQKSYILNELGLSQEWLNVLDLTNKEFRDYLKTSKELQLSEEERKKLAKFTTQQQKNNMRWELAKQKLLISILPAIQKIMDFTSKIALTVTDWLEKNPKWLNVLKDILLLLAGNAVIKTIAAFSKLLSSGGILATLASLLGLKGLGKAGGKAIFGATAGAGLAKLAGKKGVGAALGIVGKRGAAALGGLAGGPIGAIFSIAMAIWTIVDLFNLFLDKEDKTELDVPDPTEIGDRYNYQNVKSNMTNNFYNNPQPATVVINELANFEQRYLAIQYR